MTQEDLAHRVSVLEGRSEPLMRQTVQQWEAGLSAPRHRRMAAVAQALGVSVQDLLNPGVLQVEPAPHPRARVRLQVAGDIRGLSNRHVHLTPYPTVSTTTVDFPINDPAATCWRVVGHELAPRYRHGEYLVLSPGAEPRPGVDVLVRCRDGRILLGTFAWQLEDQLQLLPLNEGSGPITLLLTEIETMQPVAGHVMPLEGVVHH